MRLVRYFATYYVAMILLTLAALVVLVVAVSLVENLGILASNEEGGVTALGLAYFGAIEYAYQMLPVACFVGALVAGTQLARRGEVMAVQAAGCGPLYLGGPFLGVVLFTACLGSACGEFVLPGAIAERARLQREEIKHVDPLTQFYTRRAQWFRERDLLLYLPAVDVHHATFSDPMVYKLNDGLISYVIDAKLLRHNHTGWWLDNAEKHAVDDPTIERSESMALDLRVTPTDLIDVTGNPREMRAADVAALIARRQHAGFDVTAHRLELASRFAFPLSAVGLVMTGVPWALDPNRRRSLSGILGGGVLVIAGQLALSHVFRLLALAHKISPALGAWGGPVACLVAVPMSYALYRRLRT